MHANLRRYSMPSAGIYDRVTGVLCRGRYDEIARQIVADVPPGAAVLDAGCGPGEIAIRVARLAPSLRLTGLDIDAAMIDRAERKAARALRVGKGTRADEGTRAAAVPTFVVSDVASMPFPDETFDVVVSSFSVHHWPTPHAGLAEVLRVLKVGGRAIIWDIVDPWELALADPGAGGGGHGGSTGHGGANTHATSGDRGSGPGWLTALRMLLQFRKATPRRYDFVKDPGGPRRASI